MIERNLLPEMRAHLKRLSETTGPLQFPIRAYLAGGMALHFHTGSRMSKDVDIQWSHRIAVPPDLQIFEVKNPDDPEDVVIVSMDGNFGDYLGSFHPDWKQDSQEVERYGDIILHVISPLDLAVSKIARFSERDREDIEEMAAMRMFTANELDQRAREAIEYFVGDTTFIKINQRDAVEIVKRYENSGLHP